MSFPLKYLLFAMIILVLVVYYLLRPEQIPTRDVESDRGKFCWLKQSDWVVRPMVPISDNTLVGIPVFDSERHGSDAKSLAGVYGSQRIGKDHAWVVMGAIPNNLAYWSFAAVKFSNGAIEEYTPIEAPFNNTMVPELRQGDDFVCIMSPNYKMADYVANKIRKERYSVKSDKHVVFRYFPLPDYNPHAHYNLVFEAHIHKDCALPKFKAVKYTPTVKDSPLFPFYPVQASTSLPVLPERTIREPELGGGPQWVKEKVQAKITRPKRVIEPVVTPVFSNDVLYYDSGDIYLAEGDNLGVAVVDHSSNGKALFSELLMVDGTTNKVYANVVIGTYNALSVENSIKVKLVEVQPAPSGVTRILERICTDLVTKFRPDPSTILPMTVYVW